MSLGSSGISLKGVVDLSDKRLLRRIGVCKQSVTDDVGLTDRDLVAIKCTCYLIFNKINCLAPFTFNNIIFEDRTKSSFLDN